MDFQTLVILISGFVAALLGTLSGFGTGMVMTTLLVLLLKFDVKTTVMLVAVFHGMSNAIKLVAFRPHIQWDLTFWLGIPAIACAFLGAELFGWFSGNGLLLLLGIILSWYAATNLWGVMRFPISASPECYILGGSISGLLAGLIGVGGAVRGLFLHAFKLSPDTYIATSAAIALMVDIIRIPTYYHVQPLTLKGWETILALFVVSGIAGVIFAKKLVKSISKEKFHQGVLWMFLIFGIYYTEKSIRLIWQGWFP